MVVPTDETRVKGGNPGELKYQYIIEGTGNSKITITGDIEIICSKAVQIIPPKVLSSSQLFYNKGTGLKDYKINEFHTDDTNC